MHPRIQLQPGTRPEPGTGPLGPRERTRFERLRSPLVTGGLVGGLTIALHFRDPHSSGSWGFCPFYALTGLYCPGCGGLRAVNDLTNGDLVGAASSNLVFVALVPLIVLLWVRWTGRAWTGHPTSGVAEPSRRRRDRGVRRRAAGLRGAAQPPDGKLAGPLSPTGIRRG